MEGVPQQVYVNAPHISTGPLPVDLPAALVNGRPTYEWWNAQRVSNSETRRHAGSTGRRSVCSGSWLHPTLTRLWCSQGEGGKVTSYDGFDESLAFIKDYIALHGPFDGLWAFSQV